MPSRRSHRPCAAINLLPFQAFAHRLTWFVLLLFYPQKRTQKMLDCWLKRLAFFAVAAATTTLQLYGTRNEPHQQSLAVHKKNPILGFWGRGREVLVFFLVLYTAQKSSLLNTAVCDVSRVLGWMSKAEKKLLMFGLLTVPKGCPFFSYYRLPVGRGFNTIAR